MNWMRGKFILVLTLAVTSYPNILFAAQAKIHGDYCYQYGDSESLVAAKEISYAMALRKAIESYKTFVASTSVVKDFQLRKDLVETIASGYVENVQIVKLDVKERTVCTELVGFVSPNAVKSIIARKIGTVQRTKNKEFQGLLSNDRIKILNYKKTICGEHTKWPCVEIVYQAKRDISGSSTSIIIDCYDRDGNQIEGNKTIVPAWDLYKGEVRRTWFELNNDKIVSFELRLR